MSSNIIPLSSIPTISDLYKSSDLQAAPSHTSTSEPSSSLNGRVSIIRTSITDLEVTSIVNAANESLLGGGGVDGAIHRAAGRSLLAECRTLGGCDTGSAKITSGHDLPASYVIHAVGPIYASAKRGSSTLPAELLAGCYRTSLQLAAEKGGSIAFSCLSTGVYGYPSGEAAEVALGVVREWLMKEEAEEGQGLQRVIFCCFEAKDERAYESLIPKFFPPPNGGLPNIESADATKNTTASGSSSIPLDTQASSLVAAAEQSANSEEPTTMKLKITNPDIDTDDWETIEKPENLSEITSAAQKDMAKSEATASKSAGQAIPDPTKEGSAVPEPEPNEGGNLGKNSLLKDW